MGTLCLARGYLLDTANIVCKAEALGFKFETYVGHSKPKPADNQIISQ